ncbi:hypothetical protein DH2020_014489 [Rehmannia glutinosa]|uniref:DUF4005 domain-containing protein n=1 Tax=Rehmannia glutinosa TaxID=99300 RepID=A0ABR0WXG2_REHGL
MGRATRWLKRLFGINSKEKDGMEYSVQPKDKRRWRSGPLVRDGTVLCHNFTTMPPNITPAEAAWLRSFYSEPDNEQKQHARAVAAATAVAADAAVAAAQAAAAVVRLTSQGREKWAAAKIQTAFRGYLARKAFRALKGLVKIQALARGFLVRKQAAATLHSMQALIRAQASVRAQKTRRFINNDESFHSQFKARKSLEKFDEHPTWSLLDSKRLSPSFGAATNAVDESPKIVEMDTKSRSKRANTNTWMSEYSNDEDDYSSAKAISSPFPFQISTLPDTMNFADQERDFSTAQSTPRFATSAQSVCGESNLGYMANTQSFKSKRRSQSAPKQRPEPGPKRRPSLHELMGTRNSLNGIRMQISCSQAQQAINFKNAIVGKLGNSSNFVRERV